MKIAILILAAGKSTRMQQPKQLLQIKGKSLLSMAIQNALLTKVDKVSVVIGAKADIIAKSIDKFQIQTIINKDFEDGLSSSIVKGVEQLQNFDALLITLADQPYVDAVYLKTMILEFKSNPDKVIASNYNGINGVPALFPKVFYSNLLNLKGDKGAKQLLNSEEIPVKTLKCSVDLLDIDTPEDYKKLKNK